MLKEFIRPALISLQVKVSNWEEAVRKAGNLMVQAGYCEDRYVDAMVQAVSDMGPYMVLAPGIALAHARPEDGMLKVGMSLINLAVPVEFGSEKNDPVSLVIAFGGVDKEKHVKMLQHLSQFLLDEGNQELLKSTNSVEEIISALAEEPSSS
ncbi:MAG: PTS sugar transporter subunit IIA [Anaerolineales bacterium]